MASIPLKPTTISNLQAPDFTKAGALFATALDRIGKAGQQLQQGRQAVATDAFGNALREADTLDELGQITTDELITKGADSAALTAAENSLRTKQVDISGNNRQTAIDEQIAGNIFAAENILKTNPNLGVSLDTGGNPTFATPEDETQYIRALQAPDSGFKPFLSETKTKASIREGVGKKYNLSEEQIQQIATRDSSYRKELSTLDENQQTQVAQQDAQIDYTTTTLLDQVDFEDSRTIRDAGMTPEQATEILTTSETELFKILNGTSEKTKIDTGEELFFFSHFFYNKPSVQIGGIDIKEKVLEVIKEFPNIRPYQIVEALQKTIDTEEGAQNIDESDFDGIINDILANPNKHSDLLVLSDIPANNKAKKDNILNEQALVKQSNLRRFKGTEGITNINRNARLFNTTVANNQRAIAPVGTPTGIVSAEENAAIDAAIASQQGATATPLTIEPQSEAENITNRDLTENQARALRDTDIVKVNADIVDNTIAAEIVRNRQTSLDPNSVDAATETANREAALIADAALTADSNRQKNTTTGNQNVATNVAEPRLPDISSESFAASTKAITETLGPPFKTAIKDFVERNTPIGSELYNLVQDKPASKTKLADDAAKQNSRELTTQERAKWVSLMDQIKTIIDQQGSGIGQSTAPLSLQDQLKVLSLTKQILNIGDPTPAQIADIDTLILKLTQRISNGQ